jgi:rubrerythrin
MSIRFNADEVFEMAERIEINGAKFYRRAAELKGKADKAAGDLLLKLAKMEDQHRQIFSAMRKELPEDLRERTEFDPYLEANLYLGTMADAHPGEGAPSAAAALTGQETFPQIVRIAIDLEGKSIVFYLGLRDMVPEKLGKGRIDAIIAEEKQHIVTLTDVLRNAVDR